MPEKVGGTQGTTNIQSTEKNEVTTLIVKRTDEKNGVSQTQPPKEISGPTGVKKMTQAQIMEDLSRINSAITVKPESNFFVRGCQAIGRWFEKVFTTVNITALNQLSEKEIESGSVLAGGKKLIKHERDGKVQGKRDEIKAASMEGLKREIVPNDIPVASQLQDHGQALFSRMLEDSSPDVRSNPRKISEVINNKEMRVKLLAVCEANFASSDFKTFEKLYDAFAQTPPNLSAMVDVYQKYIDDSSKLETINLGSGQKGRINRAYNEFINDQGNPDKAKAFMDVMAGAAQHVANDINGNQINLLNKDSQFTTFYENI